MYQINATNYDSATQRFITTRIYSPDRVDDDNRYVDEPILTSEVNCASVLEFDLPPESKGYDLIHPLKTIVKVYDSVDGSSTNRTRLFKGRALYIDTKMSGVKHVYCEGELAYLQDSVVMAYQYEGTVQNLFKKLVNDHNAHMPSSKEFKIGNITVTDKNDTIKCESTTYPTTFEEMQKQLLDEVGGYIIPRCEVEDGTEVTYLDYLEDASVSNSQKILFGENLIDISERSSAEEVFTVLIPLGAAKKRREGEVEKRINISSVNGGSKELQDADGIAEFGKIYKVMIWDKIKDPSKLKTRGQKALARGSNDVTEIELSAVDMHLLNVDASAIRLGERNEIISPPHGFDKWMPCKKIVLDMENPERSMYYFGRMGKTLTGLSQNTNLKLEDVGFEVDDLGADIEDVSETKASIDSPAFTGEPTAPTQLEGTSNTTVATTEFVDTSITKLCFYAGDSLTNYQYRGASFLTTSSTQVHITIPLGKIVKASAFNVSSCTMVTRQDGKYTHGSSASVFAAWDVTSCTIDAVGNLTLKLTRSSDISNAVNNAPIGVDLKISGTFA